MEKDDILKREKLLYKAIKESDIELLDELLHDDLLFVIPSGEVITKEKDLQSYRDGRLKIIELIPNAETVHIINDVAVITLTMELRGNYDGQEFASTYRYFRCWQSFPTGIKVIGGSGMIINA